VRGLAGTTRWNLDDHSLEPKESTSEKIKGRLRALSKSVKPDERKGKFTT